MRTRTTLAVVIGVAVLALVLVVSAAGIPGVPGDDDVATITALVDEAQRVKHIAWPASALASPVLPAASRAAFDKDQSETLARIGTTEFADTAHFDWPGFLQEARDGDGVVVLSYCYQIVDVAVVPRVGRGAVVRVKLWDEETRGVWSTARRAVTAVSTVDATPVLEYRAVKVGGQWRLAAEKLVEMSEDESSTVSGPETPHSQQPLKDPA